MASSETKKRSGSTNINVEVASIAPTEDNDTTRFTATGRPMPATNISALGGMVTGTSGFGGTAGPGNTLPWKFRDTDIITVPIPTSELEGEPTDDATAAKPRRRSSLTRWLVGSEKAAPFKMVRMTRGEYLKYWAKDDKGRYIGTEPRGSGRERLRNGLKQGGKVSLVGNRNREV